jgi:hypothetical protein
MGESARFQFLRPLGTERRVSVACDTKAVEAARLVVVERITRTTLSESARRDLEARVRTVADFAHPRLVGVRELTEQGSEVLIVSDFVDGEAFASLLTPPEGTRHPSLEVLLRVLLDVLDALGSMHGHHDEAGKTAPLVHGAMTPTAVIIDERGFVRLASTCRGPRLGAPTEYTPPEVRSGQPLDVRTDIFGVGAMLWRALMGDAARPAKIPATGVKPEVPWAEPLVDVVRGAVIEAREQRWPNAAAMAGEIRRASGERTAAAGEVGEYVKEGFGARIKARRSTLTTLDDEAPPPSSSELVSMSDLEVVSPATPRVPEAPAPTPPPPPAASAASAQTPPPPLPKRAAIARVALVKNPPVVLEADALVDDEPAPESEGLPLVNKKPSTPAEPPPALPEAESAEPDIEALQRLAPTVPPTAARTAGFPSARGLGMAAILLLTLGIGWWLGKQSAGAPEPSHVEPVSTVACTCPPTPPAPATTVAASMPPKDTSTALASPAPPAIGTPGASSVAQVAPTIAATSTNAPTAATAVAAASPAPPAPKPTAKPNTRSAFAATPRPTTPTPPTPHAPATRAPTTKAAPATPQTRTGSRPAYHPDDL